MSEANGWAVVSGGGHIYVKTVSDTRRAAIVNYLVTEHLVPVSMSHNDKDIDYMWAQLGGHVLIKTVTITTDRQ